MSKEIAPYPADFFSLVEQARATYENDLKPADRDRLAFLVEVLHAKLSEWVLQERVREWKESNG